MWSLSCCQVTGSETGPMFVSHEPKQEAPIVQRWSATMYVGHHVTCTGYTLVGQERSSKLAGHSVQQWDGTSRKNTINGDATLGLLTTCIGLPTLETVFLRTASLGPRALSQRREPAGLGEGQLV